LPGVGSKPVRVNVPAPVIIRASSAPETPGTKLKFFDATDRAVLIAPSVAVYIVNGVAVAVLKLVIVTQPVQFANAVKLPDSPPILAGFKNVIDVAV
jgi:hypothetical protein